jgi:hypothetical protein
MLLMFQTVCPWYDVSYRTRYPTADAVAAWKRANGIDKPKSKPARGRRQSHASSVDGGGGGGGAEHNGDNDSSPSSESSEEDASENHSTKDGDYGASPIKQQKYVAIAVFLEVV